MEEMETRRGPSGPAVVVIGALAVLGALTLVQWLLSGLFGFLTLVVTVVVLVAVAWAVLSAKAGR
jgi:hypothetical protein